MKVYCPYCGNATTKQVNFEIEEEVVIEITYLCSTCNQDFTDRYEYEETVDGDDEVIQPNTKIY